METYVLPGKQPRRKFLGGLLTAGAGLITMLLAPRRAGARGQEPPVQGAETGPILYRRTEEAERYYRTLYR